MANSYLIAGCRTPVGKFLGNLSPLRAVELGGQAIRATLERSSIDPESIDQVLMGQVIPAGAGQAPARQAGVLAGLPVSTGAATINKVCGSGLYTVMLADAAIRSDMYRRVIAGGMESMSQAPHLLRKVRSGWKYGDQPLVDSIEVDGLSCAYEGQAMGCFAQAVADEERISRTDQDRWALRSHRRAVAAQDDRHFESEVIPVTIPSGKRSSVVSIDEGPRRDCDLAELEKLTPVFGSARSNELTEMGSSTGSVTAGNASTLSDGAAAVLVVDESSFRSLQPPWAFRIVGHCSFAAEHRKLFTAPIGAIEKLLATTRTAKSAIDLFEINEAFASQTIACARGLGLDDERLNIHGGAIALGHPLGCSGTRVLVTLIYGLLAQSSSLGIASLCLGGGEAVALMIERC